MRRTASAPARTRFGVGLVGIFVALALVAPPAAARSDHIEDPRETEQRLDIHYAEISVDRTDGARVGAFRIATYRRWRIKDVVDPMLRGSIFVVDFDSRRTEGADYTVSVRGAGRTITCELHRHGKGRVLSSVEGTKGPRTVTCSLEWKRIRATRAVRWKVYSFTWPGDRAPDHGFSTI